MEGVSELAEALIETGVNFIDAENIHDYDTKSIAILIFESLGDTYFGYGLCNDLISEFDRISQVYVADIQDVIKYKDSDIALPDIGRKLEVDNIIDGVCRIENDRIHISIRMMSLETGKTIWKEELSELTANLNVLRGTIVKRVLEILEVQVPEFILGKMSKGMTANPEAYKLYHEGLYHIEIVKNTSEYPKAKSLFEKAIKFDENFIEAYAQCALTTFKMGHPEEAEELIEDALEKAEDIDNDQGRAKLLDILGIINSDSDKIKKALKNFQKALKIYVKYEDQLSESKTLSNLSHSYIHLDEADKGIEVLEKSIHLKEKLEKDNLMGTSLAHLGTAYRNKFQYGKAINSYRKAFGKFNRYNYEYLSGRLLIPLARCFCDMGLGDRASEYLEKATVICSKFNEPLIMGWIKNYEANVFLLDQDYEGTVDYLEDALEIFQDGELRKPTAAMLLELMVTHIVFDKPEKLEKLRNKYERLSKKLSDSSLNDSIINCIDYFMEASGFNYRIIELENVTESLEKLKLSEELYKGWWVLAKSAKKLKDAKAEKKYYKKASECLKQFADNLDGDYKQSFLNKFPVRNILEEFSL